MAVALCSAVSIEAASIVTDPVIAPLAPTELLGTGTASSQAPHRLVPDADLAGSGPSSHWFYELADGDGP
jgi:hypothetical protein